MVDAVIRLFESMDTSFDTLGIGYLPDATYCEVTEERNGLFELVMKYPITGKRYEEIQLRRLLVAKPNPYADPQPFRIYEISKPINGIVSIYAEHISYDLTGIPVLPFTAGGVQSALRGLKGYAAFPCPFTFDTDKTTSSDFKITTPSSIKSYMGGMEGSILDIYGGEYEYNCFHVYLWNHRGENRGVTIRYGKNLTDIEQEENCDNVYTGVYPYWYSEDEENGGYVIASPSIVPVEGIFNYQKVLVLDFSTEWDTMPTPDQLKARAERYIKENNIGVPKVSISVSFENMTSSSEYENLALLETIHLCDTVTVEFPALGVKATAKCNKTIYNVLTNKYTSISLGDAKPNFADTLTDNNDQLAKNFQNILASEVSNITSNVNKDLSNVHKTLADMGIDINKLNIGLEGVGIDLDELDRQLAELGISLNDAIAGINVTINGVNGTIGDLKKDISQLDGDLSGLEGAVDELHKSLLSEATARELAIANATKLITGNSGGNVVLHSSTNANYPDEILIMDKASIAAATKLWRFNLSGFGYSKSGYNGPYGIAVTMDGAINADYITTGVMQANRIKGGLLTLGGGNNGNGTFALLDAFNNIIGVMNNAGIQMLRGQIKGPTIEVGGQNNNDGSITVRNASNTVIGKWDKDGINLLSGAIKGPSITLGGPNNTNGYLSILNASNVEIGRWDKDGIKMNDSGDFVLKKTVSGVTYIGKIGEVKYLQSVGSGTEERTAYGITLNDGITMTSDGIYGSKLIVLQTIPDSSKKNWFELMMNTDTSKAFFELSWHQNGRYQDFHKAFLTFDPENDGNRVLMKDSEVMFGGSSATGVYMASPNTSSSAIGATFEYLDSPWNAYRLFLGTGSSIRFKEVIRDMTEDDLEEIYKIQPVIAMYKEDYLRKEDERYRVPHPMFIAEDVAEHFPEAADHEKDGEVLNWNYRVMIPAMFQMLKSQKEEIDLLKIRIKELERNR